MIFPNVRGQSFGEIFWTLTNSQMTILSGPLWLLRKYSQKRGYETGDYKKYKTSPFTQKQRLTPNGQFHLTVLGHHNSNSYAIASLHHTQEKENTSHFSYKITGINITKEKQKIKNHSSIQILIQSGQGVAEKNCVKENGVRIYPHILHITARLHNISVQKHPSIFL